MKNILNFTNGDVAVEIMKEANIPGVFLPWRDVLYDGPVPKKLSLEELSQVRAEFIISRGWGTSEDIKRDFIERDNTLKSSDKYEKVILWFEHDLYDQLQILQILDWFHMNPTGEIKLSIICTNKYLAMLSPRAKGTLPFNGPARACYTHGITHKISKGFCDAKTSKDSNYGSTTPHYPERQST